MTDVLLISSILALAVIFLLGIFVFLNNRRDRTNQIFFLLTLSVFIWVIFVLIRFYSQDIETILLAGRFTFGIASLVAFFVYSFSKVAVTPTETSPIRKMFLYISSLVVIIIASSEYTIKDTSLSAEKLQIDKYGWGYYIFAIYFVSFVALSVFNIGKKIYGSRNSDQTKKTQLKYILVGFGISLITGFTLSVLLPFFSGIFEIAKIAPLSTLPFIIFTSIAILRHNLFSTKIVLTELFIFSLWIFILIRTLVATTMGEMFMNLGLLVATIFLGILIIRSVLKEVKQREEIEKLAEDLGKANERLQELDKQKTEFVSIASHQLRSPLTAIKGYSSMLLEGSFGKVPDKAKGAIDVIFQSSQKMISVIEDFLNITRIELGRMKYEMSDLDVGTLAKQVTEELRPAIEKSGLKFEFVDDGKDHNTYADLGKLNQVFNNIIDNATKYTKEGWIRVKVENLDKDGGEIVRFSVQDSGVGIEKETLPKLFEKFVRAYDAGKVNIIGTGLGLYVAKQIVEGLGGKIWAESEGKGKGSTFIVEFKHTKPLAEQEKEKKVVDFVKGI